MWCERVCVCGVRENVYVYVVLGSMGMWCEGVCVCHLREYVYVV